MVEFQTLTRPILFQYHANVLTYGASLELEGERRYKKREEEKNTTIYLASDCVPSKMV